MICKSKIVIMSEIIFYMTNDGESLRDRFRYRTVKKIKNIPLIFASFSLRNEDVKTLPRIDINSKRITTEQRQLVLHNEIVQLLLPVLEKDINTKQPLYRLH